MFKIKRNQFKRSLSLGILFFSGTSLHFFDGGIIFWFFILIILNKNNFLRIKLKDLLVLSSLILILTVFYLIKSNEIPYFVFVAIASAYIVLLNYRTNNYKQIFLVDISNLFKFYMHFTLISIFFLIFGQSLFSPAYLWPFLRQIGYIFWYIDSGGPSFLNHYRLCGLAWEPGVWQLFLNLNLILILSSKRPTKEVILSIISIVFTFSTTGLFIMVFILAANVLYLSPIKRAKTLIIPAILFFFLFSLISSNINEKLSGSGATSSSVRFGDFYVGLEMLKRSPIIGEDPKTTFNSSDLLILNTRERIWNDAVEGDKSGYLDAEMVNGFMIFLLDFGLIAGGYLLYKAFCFNLFENKKIRNVFICVIIIALFSEPISRTGFFFFFILASIIINGSKKTKYLQPVGQIN
ncbi:hypothetical protein OC25_11180 [Pedobacter kyungheensis]|uniref:O-antigen polymerase n=1 Tax=Pedobacter kyungheensis TaxID=1069985 RepID=A0A0C1DIU3_9SPHI|nr:hypothetical protein [Pedobacter kyungheensis]KIA93820.1 hypothetical protein OC25_11180 [Pedobacter kyungheensis]